MKNKQLEEHLKTISFLIKRKFPDKYFSINSGGCAFFAYNLSKELERRGIDFKVGIIGTNSSDSVIQARDNSALNIYPTYDSYANHVVIDFNGKLFDALGFLPKDLKNYLYGSHLSKHTWICKQFYNFYKNNDWNPYFTNKFSYEDRKELRRIITNVFKSYDQNIKDSSRHR